MAQHVARATQTWQPQKYLKFQRQRLRPALELLARVSELPSDNESVEIIDLGAGTGNMAPSFLKRWPSANVTFVDSSASMLESRSEHMENETLDTQRCAYVQADFESYEPTRPADLIFSNAALQWVNADKHKHILPRLYSFLKPGGVLAFQIPDTRLQPSHQRMVDAAEELGLMTASLVCDGSHEKDPSFYYELFKAVDAGAEIDMWAAVYAQVLEGENPVADFTGSTALRPYMEALGSRRLRPRSSNKSIAR
ncbi:Trans-aconitate 2-methyltransferase [Phytophthora cinnamomi]|uniref:Trans-aconitate 2-methyltransferase n=1 Tax=Phytophthora cinnamomi TaxID=4785 RepID=UPI00355A9490|nr:Trans-aconitate 2-methyltransferase [Phytophthora cinnamomi]